MKKTLITGGAGFLGSHLCERLLARGDNVTCLDNFSTGDFGNIEGLLEQPMFNVITQDVVDSFDIEVDQFTTLPVQPLRYTIRVTPFIH